MTKMYSGWQGRYMDVCLEPGYERERSPVLMWNTFAHSLIQAVPLARGHPCRDKSSAIL